MATLPTFHPRRTRWQLLFVEGAREKVPIPGKKGERVVTITGDFLREIESNHRERIKRVQEYGGGFNPLPVSLNHNIFRAVYRGERDKFSDHDLRRMAGCLDLCYYDGAEYPVGLYGLLEWTPEALHLIESGAYDALSPTTAMNVPMTDRSVLQGQSLIEIGLVYVGQLDTIGRASDWLPHDALPTEFEASDGSKQSGLRARSIEPNKHLDAVCRMAYIATTHSRGEHVDTPETPENVAAETPESAEPRANEEPRMADLSALMSALQAALVAIQDYASEAEPEGGEESSEEPESEDPEGEEPQGEEPRMDDEEMPRSLTEEAAALEDAQIRAEALECVKSRSLLARDVETFVTRRKGGEGVDDLLGSYALGARSGANTDDVDATPRNKQEPETVTATQLVARAREENPDSPVKANTRFRELLNEARENGTLSTEE